MALTNRDCTTKALEYPSDGLRPFAEHELREKLGDQWEKPARDALKTPGAKINWTDPQTLLAVIWDQWNPLFGQCPLAQRRVAHVPKLATPQRP